MSEFAVLFSRKIIDFLIGDAPVSDVNSDYIILPYCKGWEISEIAKQFGYDVSNGMGSGSPSRWMIMQSLMRKMDNAGRLSDLLAYMFDKSRFADLL